MNRILLYSGGLDSITAALSSSYDILLYVKMGHRYQEKELETIQYFSNYHGLKYHIIENNLGQFEKENAFIPLRNLILISLASNFGDEIHLIKTRGEASTDKSIKFKHMTERLVNYCLQPSSSYPEGHKVKIRYPFHRYTKTQILDIFLKQFSNKKEALSAYKKTWSCYNNKSIHCGQCNACFRRWVAEINNDIQGEYLHDPYKYLKQIHPKITFRELFITLPNNIEVYKALKKKRLLIDYLKNRSGNENLFQRAF